MTTELFSASIPRDISYDDDLFKNNRTKVKNIFVGSLFIIPLIAFLFWYTMDNLVVGIYWGIGLAGFFEVFGLAMMMNAKSAVTICQHGTLISAHVDECKIHGHSKQSPNGYILVNVSFKDKLSRSFTGLATFIGTNKEIDIVTGSSIPLLFSEENGSKFIVYSESLGISTIGKAKES